MYPYNNNMMSNFNNPMEFNGYRSEMTNYPVSTNYQMSQGMDDERFFWAPFVVGGLAGTALGYGLANNNQLNNGTLQPIYPMYPYPVYQSYPVYPSYSTSNNYYY